MLGSVEVLVGSQEVAGGSEGVEGANVRRGNGGLGSSNGKEEGIVRVRTTLVCVPN